MLKEQLKDWQGRNDTLQEEVDALEAMVQQWQEKYEKLQTDKDREQFLNKELKKFVKELQACAANNLETIRLLEIDRNYWCQRCSDETLPLVQSTSSEFQPAQQVRQSPELILCLFALMNQQEKCTKQRAILLWCLHLAQGKILSSKQLDELVYHQSIAAIQQQTSHHKNLCEGLKQELQGLKQELEDATKQTKKHENAERDQRKFNEELMKRIAASNSSNQALTNENAMLRGQLQKVRTNAVYNWQLNETLAWERGERF
jgi:predicted  nucleic acid-binding Zn-ribbon protein